jgi:MarR family 2-MHQ and catechol resistance regulon transcriptional repressor
MATKFKGDKRKILALDCFIKLARAFYSVSNEINRSISGNGLTETQFGVLEALLHLGPMSQKQLGIKLLRSGGNITMVLDNLEKRGLIVRKRSDSDRRFFFVHLTEKGRQLIEGIFPAHAGFVQQRFSVLDESEQVILGRLCRKLGLNID